MMAKGRKRFDESPQTKTADLHGYLSENAPDKRIEAANGIFDQCRELIGNITEQLLRSRFKHIAEDTIQEAWSDCLTELQERRAEFLKDRAERPRLREMAASVTMRTVWRLEMRARRERQRMTSAPSEEPSSAPEYEALSSLTALDFHRIFVSAWERLLAGSSAEEQIVLQDVGPLAFFAHDWASVAAQPVPGEGTQRPMTNVVLERRHHVRNIIDAVLERELQLDAKTRQRFLRTLLP
jgi:hypothetical protein